ncbi:eukaryotic translation initiation factor 3 subunit J [Schistocerca cancellata]|uniref:eukaryotic translation initiation factor 3 subunit J n=1 Tax=Schistocerca cancellata TaxID=274614 RepID=UPI002117B1B7|nr:eukaryotic translation initiation factor 3 subunit J [Schistocerca cancellata]
MDEEWEAENFDVKQIRPTTTVKLNKWEGEDEDEDVKDNWEDEEEEEKKDVEKQEPVKPVQSKKPQKNLQEKIAEKERQQREEALRKAQAKEALNKPMTPEELQAEKKRQQKLQEEADLLVAMETFGVKETVSTGIDGMNPDSKEEFDQFREALCKKINHYSKSPHFPEFAEELIRNICVNLSSTDLKKLKNTIENMFLEKSKIEKGDKAKKKGKGKAKLRVEGDNTIVNEYSAYADYDYDDFI